MRRMGCHVERLVKRIEKMFVHCAYPLITTFAVFICISVALDWSDGLFGYFLPLKLRTTFPVPPE